MPPGIQPPLLMRYSASTVPILQLSMGSNTLPEQQLFDISANFLRTELATVQGAMIPWPYGGKMRYIVVDLVFFQGVEEVQDWRWIHRSVPHIGRHFEDSCSTG